MSTEPTPQDSGTIPATNIGTIGRRPAPPAEPIPLSQDEYNKFNALIRSRKFWTTVIAATVSTYLYASGELSAEAYASTAALVAGIYVGSVAIEDGLRNLINIWTE